MSVPSQYRYTKEHEWAVLDGSEVSMGITDYAQKELGDVVFIDLPAVGAQVRKGASFATVESVKAVSDIYAPVDGVVQAVNQDLSQSPELINQSPFEAAWIAKITPTNPGQLEELLDASSYSALIQELSK